MYTYNSKHFCRKKVMSTSWKNIKLMIYNSKKIGNFIQLDPQDSLFVYNILKCTKSQLQVQLLRNSFKASQKKFNQANFDLNKYLSMISFGDFFTKENITLSCSCLLIKWSKIKEKKSEKKKNKNKGKKNKNKGKNE